MGDVPEKSLATMTADLKAMADALQAEVSALETQIAAKKATLVPLMRALAVLAEPPGGRVAAGELVESILSVMADGLAWKATDVAKQSGYRPGSVAAVLGRLKKQGRVIHDGQTRTYTLAATSKPQP